MCPCKPSACADPAETGESKGQSSAPSCAPGAPSADGTDVVQPRGAPEAGHAQGNAGKRPAPELPTNMQNTNPKTRPDLAMDIPPHGCSSPWIFLPVDILEGRVCSRSSAPKATLAARHRSRPSTTAQSSAPQFMLQNTWLMRESQSLECWPPPRQFWHFSHQSTRNKSHLLPRWFTGITKPLCAGGSRPRWHSQVTVKSSAGSKTA